MKGMVLHMTNMSPFAQSTFSMAANILGVDSETLSGHTFAELGGSSLDASRLVTTLMRETGVRLRACDIMSANDFGVLLFTLSEQSTAHTSPDARPHIIPGNKIPLTWQQKIIWFQTQLDPYSPSYYFHATLHFDTIPDITALRQQLANALRQHPVLRIRLERTTKEVFQIVPPLEVSAAEIDFQEISLPAVPTTEQALIEAVDGNHPFDLSTGPLVRWLLIHLPGDEAVLLHTEHHLVHDGVSFITFLNSLNDTNESREPDYSYFEYALAQRPPSEEEIAQVAKRLSTADLTPFPARGTIRDNGADLHLRIPIPNDLLHAVKDAAKAAQTSIFAAFLAANVHAIGTYRGTQSFVVFTGSDNRPPEYNNTVGMFVSAVPVLMQVDSGQKPIEHLHAVNSSLREALVHSNLPIQEIVRAMGYAVRGGNTLISTGFSMFEHAQTTFNIAGQPATVCLGVFSGSAKFPLDAVLLLSGEGLTQRAELMFEGEAASVSEDDVWAIWTIMVNWLKEFAGKMSPPPEVSVSSLIKRIVHHATRQPDMPALVMDSETISYDQLLSFAHRARPAVEGHRRVGILGTSSPHFFAVAFAVLHAGSTYVPLPADQAVERLVTMARLAACDLLVVVGDDAVHQLADALQTQLTNLPIVSWQTMTAQALAPVEPEPSNEAAYIIFTSGSTGVPNGVLAPRSGLDHLCDWVAEACHFEPGSPVAQWASVGFDASALDVWPTLWAGGSVHIIPKDMRIDPIDLMSWLAANVQSIFVVSSLAELLFQLDWPADCQLETLMTGGETLHAVPTGLPFRVLNAYGPTETTIYATAHWVSPGETMPSIGRPFSYVQGYVIDTDGQLIHEGEGELWLGGPGVAQGYAGNFWKTATRFIPNPYSDDGDIIYRTGDIVYRDADGMLHFRGRRDRQVKIDGVRLELGEIEAVAMRQPGVRLAVATLAGNKPSIYIVADADTDKDTLTQTIRDALPAQVAHLKVHYEDTLPLTTSGKIDIRNLSTQSSNKVVV